MALDLTNVYWADLYGDSVADHPDCPNVHCFSKVVDYEYAERLQSELETARAEIEQLYQRIAELNTLSFKWMDAHDKLAAGKEYSFPSVVDLPEALAEIERLTADNKKYFEDYRIQNDAIVRLTAEIERLLLILFIADIDPNAQPHPSSGDSYD